MRATRATKPGKLNQRISRIYRHAIPGLPRMHAHEVSLNLRPNISPRRSPRRKTGIARKTTPSGATDLSTSFLPLLSLSLSRLSLSSFLISVNFERTSYHRAAVYVFHPFLQPRGSKSLSHPLLEIEKACIREFRVCTLLLLLYICIIYGGRIVSMILSHIISLSYSLMKAISGC